MLVFYVAGGGGGCGNEGTGNGGGDCGGKDENEFTSTSIPGKKVDRLMLRKRKRSES